MKKPIFAIAVGGMIGGIVYGGWFFGRNITQVAYGNSGGVVQVANINSSGYFSWFFTKNIKGSGRYIKEEREVENFSKITIRGEGELVLRQAEHEHLVVEADDNLMPYIISEVFGGELFLGQKQNCSLQYQNSIRYFVSVKDIKGISVSGSVKVLSEKIEADLLTLKSSGSSSVYMQLDSGNLTVKLSGSGKLNLNGCVESQEINASGASRYDAKDLESKICRVKISGAASVKLNVNDELRGEVSGVSKICYRGNPQVDINKSGVAKVVKFKD